MDENLDGDGRNLMVNHCHISANEYHQTIPSVLTEICGGGGGESRNEIQPNLLTGGLDVSWLNDTCVEFPMELLVNDDSVRSPAEYNVYQNANYPLDSPPGNPQIIPTNPSEVSSSTKVTEEMDGDLMDLLDLNFLQPSPSNETEIASLTQTVQQQSQEIAALKQMVYSLQAQMQTVLVPGKIYERQIISNPNPFDLPLKNLEAIAAFNKYLNNQDNQKTIVDRVSRTGGKNATIATRRVLEQLFTNVLAMQLNWAGTKTKDRKSKIAFKNYKNILKVVLDAVESIVPGGTQLGMKVEETIKVWLKSAKTRQRAENGTSTENRLGTEDEEGPIPVDVGGHLLRN